MTLSEDKSSDKYKINFNAPTNINTQHIGDVNTSHYNPVSNMTITIDKMYAEQMQQKYRDSLTKFVDKVNEEIQKEKDTIPISKGAPFQTKVNELAEATAQLKEGEIDKDKRETIQERLKAVSKELVKSISKNSTHNYWIYPFGTF